MWRQVYTSNLENHDDAKADIIRQFLIEYPTKDIYEIGTLQIYHKDYKFYILWED
jgi:hypothetical protein